MSHVHVVSLPTDAAGVAATQLSTAARLSTTATATRPSATTASYPTSLFSEWEYDAAIGLMRLSKEFRED